MKNIKFLILFIALTLFSCERDDICAASTPTTPQLLIEFYDITNPEDLKNVPRITIYGEGLVTDESGNSIEPTIESEATLVFNENTSSVSLPLVIGEEGQPNSSRFIFEKDTNLRLDENDTTDSNTDILEITYIPEFEYVSRACGYKAVFTNLEINIESDSDTWISSIEIIETTINNENTVHVYIFH